MERNNGKTEDVLGPGAYEHKHGFVPQRDLPRFQFFGYSHSSWAGLRLIKFYKIINYLIDAPSMQLISTPAVVNIDEIIALFRSDPVSVDVCLILCK